MLSGLSRERIQRQPSLGQIIDGGERQIESLWQQPLLRVIARVQGFSHHLTGDQGPIVMTRAAQFQQKIERLPLLPRRWQGPTAAGIEEIALMDQHPIDPEAHLIGPPTQHQTLTAAMNRAPGLRTDQTQAQTPPNPTSRPGQQSPCSPVRTVNLAPRISECRTGLRGIQDLPSRQEIQPRATAKRFNPLRSLGLKTVLHRVFQTLPHRMMPLSQTPVGLHARPQDLRLLGRLLLPRDLRVRLPG